VHPGKDARSCLGADPPCQESHAWRTRFYLGYTIINYPRNLGRGKRDLKYQVCRPYDVAFHELTGIWTWSSEEYEWMLWREYCQEV